MHKTAENYNSGLSSFWLFNNFALYLGDPSVVKEIFINEGGNLDKGEGFATFNYLLKNNIVTMNSGVKNSDEYEEWKYLRILHKDYFFNRKSLINHQSKIQAVVGN